MATRSIPSAGRPAEPRPARPKIVQLRAKGQLTLPAAMRSRLGLAEGDSLRLSLEAGRVVIEPAESTRWSPAPPRRPRPTREQIRRRAEMLADLEPITDAELDAIEPVAIRGEPLTIAELEAAFSAGRQ